MASSLIQRSLAAGEIGPALYGRADQTKYQTGLKTCRNFVVMRHGGVTNRTGPKFIAEVKDSSARTYFMKFVFNDEQTYVIEMGNLYFRFYREGAQLLSGGPPYEVVTPYVTADLSGLKFVQSGDVVTITHPNYEPRELARTGHTSWSLTVISFAPSISAPGGISATAGISGGGAIGTPGGLLAVGGDANGLLTDGYKVAAFDNSPAVLGVASANFQSPGNQAAAGTPIDLSWTAVAGATGYVVYKFPANAALGITTWALLAITDTNSYSDEAVATPGVPVGTAPVVPTGATVFNYVVTSVKSETYEESIASAVASCTGDVPTASNPNVISWGAVAGALEYNIYKEDNGVYGFIGTTSTTSFSDGNIEADTSITPPTTRNPFSGAGNYPSTATYFQQRRLFANSLNTPEGVWGSRIGMPKNMTISSPLQDDDAVTFTIKGRKVNEVRHLVEIDDLVVLTSGGEWVVLGDSDGVLRANQPPNLKQRSYNGASDVMPVIIGNTIVYTQARGTILRDFRQDLTEGTKSKDLSIFSPHLFEGYTIDRMDYAQIPHSIVWCVRSDGTLLGLTYLREHEVWGWHRHDTDGVFEDVCVVPEGEEDAVYVIVKRTIDGATKRYVERFASRRVTDVAIDACFLDSFLTYDGRNTTATTLSLSTAGGWTHDDELTITASAGYFAVGDIGNVMVLRSGDDSIRVEVASYTSATVVKGFPANDVPAALRAAATSDWGKAVDSVSGLGHLEGKTVGVLADGNVLGEQEVVSGAITALGRCYEVIHVGLPYDCDFTTLDLDVHGEQMRDRKKSVVSVSMLVDSSRGGFIGPDEDHLVELKTETPIGDPLDLVTGLVEVNITATWNQSGSFFVRQSDPLPMTILSAIPCGSIGG